MSPEQHERWHVKNWVLLVLSSAQKEQATDLVIGPSTGVGTSIRYKIADDWHDWAPAPGLAWPLVASELGGLAAIRDAPFPKEGIIYLAYSGIRLRWRIQMQSLEDQGVLQNLGSEIV